MHPLIQASLVVSSVITLASAIGCTAPTVTNALSPSCQEGASIIDGGTCTAQCAAGFTADNVSIVCQSGRFHPGTFTCGVQCYVPDGQNTSDPPCTQGRQIPHGKICSPSCELGFAPYETKLLCDNGILYPSSTIHCRLPCDAPRNIAGAEDPPCAEGTSIPEHGTCTPRCKAGRVLVGTPSTCSDGSLTPPSFACRNFTCTLSPTEIWTHIFPGSAAQDYAAETVCQSPSPYSTDGKGCSYCYSPDFIVNATAPPGGIEVGSAARLQLQFISLGGRRLLFKIESDVEVVWGLRAGSVATNQTVWSTVHYASVLDWDVASYGPNLVYNLGVPFVTGAQQIDTGRVTGLQATHSTISLTQPLVLPLGAHVFLRATFKMKYVIAGCSLGREGQGSLKMSVMLFSLAYNTSACSTQSYTPSCHVHCQSQFTGHPHAMCKQDNGIFHLQGCHGDCQSWPAYNALTAPNGIVNAETPSCWEGTNVQHAMNCTTRCIPGYTPVPPGLYCDDRRFMPARFTCHLNCAAPASANAGNPPCEELLTTVVLPHGGYCTPRCALGYRQNPFFILACKDGKFTPSTFKCVPLLVQVWHNASVRGRSWSALPGANHTSLVAAADNVGVAATYSNVSLVHRVVFGGPGQFELQAQEQFAGNVIDVAVIVVQPSVVILATALQRALGAQGIGGPSPVYRWHSGTAALVRTQALPTAGCSQLVAFISGGRSMLFAGSNSAGNNGMMNSTIFTWKRPNQTTNFRDWQMLQQIEIPARRSAPFSFNGMHFIFVAAHASFGMKQVAHLYQLKRTVNNTERFSSLLNFSMSSVSAVSWLGCQDDPSFADKQLRPCHALMPQDCSDIATRAACGLLCGCKHSAPLLAVALSYAPASLRVYNLSLAVGGLRFDLLHEAQTVSPLSHLCPLYSRSELYLLAAVDTIGMSNSADASRLYVWKPHQHVPNASSLEVVQQLPVTGSTTCTSMLNHGGTNHFMLLSGSTTAGSSIFALEDRFHWEAGPWGPCFPLCRKVGPETSFHNRTVACKGIPSNFSYLATRCSSDPQPPAIEQCHQMPTCALLYPHRWTTGLWSPCRGFCGIGLRERSVHCLNMTSQLFVANSVCANDVATGGKPASNISCHLPPCSSFRIVNRVSVAKRWHVIELRFYVDTFCNQTITGVPFSAGICSTCQCMNASNFWGNCSANLAFDSHVPYFAANGKLVEGTAWISACGGGMRCGAKSTWIGIHSYGAVTVQCVRIMQSGDPSHAATELTLESWEQSRGSWVPITEWSGVGMGAWVSLVVPRTCSDLLDCNGYGKVLGLPGHCACNCSWGYAGAKCNFCAVGFQDYPQCWPRHKYSRAWRIVALEVPQSRAWHVSDITVHTDVSCGASVKLPPSAIHRYIASYNGSGNAALGPDRAFDAAGTQTSWISALCSNMSLTSCGRSAPWIGVQLVGKQAVNCIKFHQGQQQNFAVNVVALDLWNGTNLTGNWMRVRSWRDITVGTIGGYAFLRLVCQDGMPAGAGILHNCDAYKLPWESCQAWCRPGYSGTSATLVCGDDYVFQGVPPSCVPNACTGGFPTGQGVVVDKCLGKTTYEKCTVTCGSGYTGNPVKYVCWPDGSLHEERTGLIGVVPQCKTGGPVVVVGGGPVTSATNILRLESWCLWLLCQSLLITNLS